MFWGKIYGDNKEYQLNGQRSPLKNSWLSTWEIRLLSHIKEVPNKEKEL